MRRRKLDGWKELGDGLCSARIFVKELPGCVEASEEGKMKKRGERFGE